VRRVERLPDRALRPVPRLFEAAHTAWWCRMHGVELAAFHALEQHEMAARVDDGDGDASFASRARLIAVSMILRAPAAFSRLASEMYIDIY
jgi:hypothetical protein